MNDFNTKYDIYRNQIENALKDVFNDKAEDGKAIREAAMYSLSAGGKRIRPVLCLAFADVFGIGMSKVLPYACAIEMIHTFSLVHDDLPGMDNDDYRRGKLTCHKVFGEAMAILAGDALLNGAYDLMLRSIDTSADMTSDLKAMRILSIATGVPGMIGGQAIDIFTSEKPMDITALGQMYSMKTGALIKAPVEIACVLAGISGKAYDYAVRYADAIGLAFQIKDDILDVESSNAVLGKTTGKDAASGKKTFVSLLGIDKAKHELNITTDNAFGALSELSAFGYDVSFLDDFTRFLLVREM